ncbi:MAG TPA: hypothetical protein VK745_02605 [Polyangiaceae bacterium]|jgi:hypothetical protein|nr:hypothetical protein [Polyangiaceae bacterium]
MTPRAWALCLLSTAFFAYSGAARAQDDDDDAPAAKAEKSAKDTDTDAAPSDDAKKPTEGAKGEAHESLVPPKPTEADEPPPVGPVERLPPSAYPEWKTRGLRGGSLWLSNNMHGMPWPYYPKTGIGVSGYVWQDISYLSLQYGLPNEFSHKQLKNQGRGLLRLTPTYSAGDYYLQGQIEVVGNEYQTSDQPFISDIDDLWIRVGQWKTWDVQVGRFEAFEVYHFGMGMDLNTVERQGAKDSAKTPDVFELGNSNSYSPNIVYRQDSIMNLAAHVYPSDSLRFELLGQLGYDPTTTLDVAGVRPAAVFDLGWLKLKAAGDYQRKFTASSQFTKASQRIAGGVGAIQFVIDPYLEFGGNIAYGNINAYSSMNTTDPNATIGDHDTAGSVTDLDYGGFANLRVVNDLLLGGGVNYDQETNQQQGVFSHLQTFGALQYTLFKQLYIKVVGAYAKAHFAPGGITPWDDTMLSGRLRLMYLY